MNLAEQRSDRPILIYLDQLEQVLFPGRDAGGARVLVEAIDRLARRPIGGVQVVLSLREDYLGRFREWARGRPELLDHGFRLGPLTVAEMTTAVCRVAERAGAAWDEAHLRRLMLDVRMPGQSESDESEVQAAFGQIVCRALWERQEKGQGSNAGSEHAEQILRHYLDATLEALGPSKEAAQRLLEEHLVDKNGNRTMLTASQAGEALPPEEAETVLEHLERAAVLRAEVRHGSRYFELGHDWLVNAVAERRQKREQEQARRRGQAEEAQRQAKERAARRRLLAIAVIAAVVAALMAFMLILTWRAAEAARKAEQTARTAENTARMASQMAGARELLARGQTAPASQVLLEVRDPAKARGWIQLATDLLTAGIPESSVRHHGEVYSAAWSPDGERIVTASQDKTARVWNADGSGDPIVLKGHEDVVYSAAWSPDGERIVTAYRDKTARVWNADGSGDPIVLKGHEDTVNSAAWSPDGKRIVTTSWDKTARVWNADGLGDPIVLKGHEDVVYSPAWSPDGKRIVTASKDGTARVWNADGLGDAIILKVRYSSLTSSAAWSPDGKRIVTTAFYGGTALVWNADGSGELLILKSHEGFVHSAAWSPDGKRILTAFGKTAQIWLLAIPDLQQALREATTYCLTPEQRQTYLLESETDARKAYEDCERSYHRTPFFPDTTAP